MIERKSGRPLGEDYILQTPMNIYGMFLPSGTEYWKINNDWWYPIVDGALLPAYAVHFTIIKSNDTYFKLVKETESKETQSSCTCAKGQRGMITFTNNGDYCGNCGKLILTK